MVGQVLLTHSRSTTKTDIFAVVFGVGQLLEIALDVPFCLIFSVHMIARRKAAFSFHVVRCVAKLLKILKSDGEHLASALGVALEVIV